MLSTFQSVPHVPGAWYDTLEAQTVRRIKQLHQDAERLARDLGLEHAMQGRERRCPLDLCEAIDNAYSDGWGEVAP